VTSLGGEFVGSEISWWRGDRIPLHSVAPAENISLKKTAEGGGKFSFNVF